MACNSGQLFVYYDEVDAFQRVHSIQSSGSDNMSLLLSAYDSTTIRRTFVDDSYCGDVVEPHLVLQVSSQPSKYKEVFSMMLEAGGTQRFLISRAKQCRPEIARMHFQDSGSCTLSLLETDIIIRHCLEQFTRMSLLRCKMGMENRCSYSLLVESLMAKFDQIVSYLVTFVMLIVQKYTRHIQLNSLYDVVPAGHCRAAVIKAKVIADRVLCNYGMFEHFLGRIATGVIPKLKSLAREGEFDEHRYNETQVETIVIENPQLCFETFTHITDHLENFFHYWGKSMPEFACDLSFDTLPDGNEEEEEFEIEDRRESQPVEEKHSEQKDEQLELGRLPLQSFVLIPGKAVCVSALADIKLAYMNAIRGLVEKRGALKLCRTQLLQWASELVSIGLGKIVYDVLFYRIDRVA